MGYQLHPKSRLGRKKQTGMRRYTDKQLVKLARKGNKESEKAVKELNRRRKHGRILNLRERFMM